MSVMFEGRPLWRLFTMALKKNFTFSHSNTSKPVWSLPMNIWNLGMSLEVWPDLSCVGQAVPHLIMVVEVLHFRLFENKMCYFYTVYIFIYKPCSTSMLQMDITMLADHIMEVSTARLKQDAMETDCAKVALSSDVRLLSGYLGEVERSVKESWNHTVT